jgi:hypothetical protein
LAEVVVVVVILLQVLLDYLVVQVAEVLSKVQAVLALLDKVTMGDHLLLEQMLAVLVVEVQAQLVEMVYHRQIFILGVLVELVLPIL